MECTRWNAQDGMQIFAQVWIVLWFRIDKQSDVLYQRGDKNRTAREAIYISTQTLSTLQYSQVGNLGERMLPKCWCTL